MKQFVPALLFVMSWAFCSCNSSQQLLTPPVSKIQRQSDLQPLPASSLTINTEMGTAQPQRGALVSASEMLKHKYAGMLGVAPELVSNFSLYSFIEDWYGVRYRMGGSDKSGIDCSAFVQRLYEQVFSANVFRTAMEQFANCRMVFSYDSLSEGDLVFFKTHGRRISHVGIYLTNNWFVHASSTKGVMISNLCEQYWSRFYAGAGKVLELEAYRPEENPSL